MKKRLNKSKKEDELNKLIEIIEKAEQRARALLERKEKNGE